MGLAQVLEPGVINQVGAPVFGGDDGVVALRALGAVYLCLVAPVAVGSEDIHTAVAVVFVGTEVKQVAWQDGFVAIGVDIGAVGFLRAEYAHLVTTIIIVIGDATGSQSTIGHEQEIIAADILDIRSFA